MPNRTLRLLPALLLLGPVVAACGDSGGGASSGPPILVVTPNPGATALPAPSGSAFDCGIPTDPAPVGTSRVNLGGPCAYVETRLFACAVNQDDFYANLHRDLAGGGSLDVNINVEQYTGPRHYDQTIQLFIQLSANGQFVNWSTNTASGTVATDLHSLQLDAASAEPLAKGGLVNQAETVGGMVACSATSS